MRRLRRLAMGSDSGGSLPKFQALTGEMRELFRPKEEVAARSLAAHGVDGSIIHTNKEGI